jgi:methyl-accepting chemotaxis protein
MKNSSFKEMFDDAKNKVEDAFNRAPEDLKVALADMMENLGKLMGDIKENLNKNAEDLKKSAEKKEDTVGATPGAEKEVPKDGFESLQESFKKAASEFKDIMEAELGHIAERMDDLTEKMRKYRAEKKEPTGEGKEDPDPKDFV